MTLPQQIQWQRLRAMTMVWCAAVFLRFLFHYELRALLWVLLVPLDAGLLAGAAVVLIGSGRLWWEQRGWRAISPAVIVVALGLVGWLTPLGRLSGACFRLWRNEADYRGHVQEILDGAPQTLEAQNVQAGPPVRVVFSWGGILDNWIGIAYDPSHRITDRSVSRMWFGGEIVAVKHLWRDWFLCTFS